MINVEYHCHTCYSKDSLVNIQDLLITAQKKKLDRVVITDHNNFQGSAESYQLDPTRFIMGEEIMTLEGELIGIFMQELIQLGFSSMRSIKILRDQGAFISVAHPFDVLREGKRQILI